MAGINSFLQLLFLLLLFGSLYLKAIKLCLCNNDVKVPCLRIERQALLQFKEAIIDTSHRLSSWHGDDCCGWEGVGCDNKTGHVLKLQLGNPVSLFDDDIASFERSTLSGEISPSLLDLKQLNVLNLSFNNFGEIHIPKFIGYLEKLRVLDLSNSHFSGKIPSQLGNLSNLIHLNLYNNSGIYTENLNWFSGLSSLSYLNLGWANLSTGSTKWLEHVCMLPSLRFLILEHSEIYYLPSSPPNSFGNITSLAGIDLSGNYFNSPIPQWLFNFSSLRYMYLISANLHGPIPDSFSNMTSLEYLDLSFNENITGFIPPSFGKLCKLQMLIVDGNQLTGGLPISLGNLEKLIHLSVADNQLNGNIPESLGNLRHLEYLDLSWNDWEGVLSEIHFANLTSLYFLSLQLPSPMLLVWKVGTDWIPPFSLTYFYVDNCQLGPLFPSWLQTQKNLSGISLTNVGINDTLPDWFFNLSLQFVVVDLSNNEIKGRIPLGSSTMKSLVLRNNTFTTDIPSNIGDMMPGLVSLDLSGNAIGGSIPSSICKMKNLITLTVSDNLLSGELPKWCWKDLQELSYLNLANNSLSGTIPKSMGYLQSLQYLQLNTNKFYGEFPSFLQNCTQLTVLDLGGNNFTGDIGPWPRQSNYYPSLQVLRLRSNHLMGNVPEGICDISNLQVLDIASNKFNGTIPKCFGNFYSMKDPEQKKHSFPLRYYSGSYVSYVTVMIFIGREMEYSTNLNLVCSIDLSDNDLTGEIPEGLTRLSNLQILNLSMNYLEGNIPEGIGRLQELVLLDMSRNKLSSPIPWSLSSIPRLVHLNLSYNNLSGKIPTGSQLQTLLDPSTYEGNPQLCGPPLLIECSSEKTTQEHLPVYFHEKGDAKPDVLWIALGVVTGFIMGFWGVCGTLLLKKTWRHAYFRYFDEMKERMFMFVIVKTTHIQRRLGSS